MWLSALETNQVVAAYEALREKIKQNPFII